MFGDIMRERIESIAGGYDLYQIRRSEFRSQDKIPFRISPSPFFVKEQEHKELLDLGHDITDYFQIIDELYRTDGQVRQLLDSGKPEIFLGNHTSRFLFVRPDIILTPHGFCITELETNPFGLTLAEILNRAYRQEGYETIVGDEDLSDALAQLPIEGQIIYTDRTQQYKGQLEFLADKVINPRGKNWQAAHIKDRLSPNIYRGFALIEYLTDPAVKDLVESAPVTFPSMTPHLEEKAAMAFLWDKRYEKFIHDQLGEAAFNHLRKVIPPTWIVGQEQYFSPGLPHGAQTALDLANISASKRTLVLKDSGFTLKSSWSEGVVFLHKKSRENTRRLIQKAAKNRDALFVIQEFRKGKDVPMNYEDTDGSITPMMTRVRLTPYYSLEHGQEGRLIAIKATGIENSTDLIHGSTNSINTALAKQNG